jgi:site-specific recombinase XerD
VSENIIGNHVDHAARAAKLEARGVHVLRHTFCSHLAMRGAPVTTIQQLAGHQDLSTTQRYMHLSPFALNEGIHLLESPGVLPRRGNSLATAAEQNAKSC